MLMYTYNGSAPKGPISWRDLLTKICGESDPTFYGAHEARQALEKGESHHGYLLLDPIPSKHARTFRVTLYLTMDPAGSTIPDKPYFLEEAKEWVQHHIVDSSTRPIHFSSIEVQDPEW